MKKSIVVILSDYLLPNKEAHFIWNKMSLL